MVTLDVIIYLFFVERAERRRMEMKLMWVNSTRIGEAAGNKANLGEGWGSNIFTQGNRVESPLPAQPKGVQ